MTKKQALEEMLKISRCLVDPKHAEMWAKAFGSSLNELGLTARRTDTFYRATPYSEEDAKALSIPTFVVASALVEKIAKRPAPRGIFHGAGRNAEWITEGSVKILKAF